MYRGCACWWRGLCGSCRSPKQDACQPGKVAPPRFSARPTCPRGQRTRPPDTACTGQRLHWPLPGKSPPNMCGIVGAIADRDVVPVLIEGLKRLEYRGYDSAGIAVVEAGGVRRVRSTGRVAEMEGAADSESFSTKLGLGHTRWATHGGVTEINDHRSEARRVGKESVSPYRSRW